MKVIVALVVLGGLAFIGIKYLDTGLNRLEFDMHVAFGEPTETEVQMDLALTQRMVERDDLEGSSINNSAWQIWMDRHFELLDDDGEPVLIKYQNGSSLIGGKPGSPEVGYLSVRLIVGQTYTLRYTPVRGESLVATSELTAPSRRRSMFLMKLIGRG